MENGFSIINQYINFMKRVVILSLLIGLTQFIYSQTSSFKTVWEDPNGDPLEVHLPINPQVGLVYNFDIDWGDGSSKCCLSSDASHNFSGSGPYTVTITGDFPAIFMKASETKENLIDITQWGVEWETMAHAFSGCENLGFISATDDPDLSNASDLSYMFHNCKNMNGTFGSWVVSTIINMRGTFFGAESFNRQLTTWNVSNVTDMTSMFENAKSYNRSMKWWVTTSLEKMNYMFAGAEAFNRNVFNNFDVSNVQEFVGVFKNALVFEGKDPNDTDSSDKDISDWVMDSAKSLNSMFAGAESFDFDISSWNVNLVEDFSFVFHGAKAFDQNIGGWDISSAEDMKFALSGSGISTCNYESTLEGWASSAGSNVTLGADGLVYYDQTGRNSLLSNSWSFTGDIENRIDECNLISDSCGEGRSTFFRTTWLVPDDGNGNGTITIPTNGNYSYDYDIDWTSDGIWDVIGATGNEISPTYSNGTNLEISIRGDFPTIRFYNSGEEENIVSIDQWGCIEWESFERSFQDCNNLEYSALDAPDLSKVEKLSHMFDGCEKLNGDISGWNVSNVTDVNSMFRNAVDFDNGGVALSWGDSTSNFETTSNMFFGASSFNQAIGDWNTTNVTTMSSMFEGAASFNQDIDNWDVSSCITFFSTFNSASSFNNGGQPLNSWDVSEAITMARMFMYCPFNQDISDWDVSKVETFQLMFRNNPNFNQNINYDSTTGAWNVANATVFSNMFEAATSFNQPLDNWIINTSNPVSMSWMFYSASNFDQDLSSWDVSQVVSMKGMFGNSDFDNNGNSISSWDSKVSNVIDMHRMFSNCPFNRPINGWHVDSVVDMSMMFYNNLEFDQPLYNWNVSSVENMGGMFYRCPFNQDISSWVVSDVTNMSSMFYSSSFDKDISNWDVSSVINMYRMFKGSPFNHDIGDWNLSSIDQATLNANNDLVGSMVEMLDNCGMSRANYEYTLTGWNQSSPPDSLTLGANNLFYCDPHAGRDSLMGTYSWTINDDIDNCTASLTRGNQPPTVTPTTDLYEINNSNGILRVIPKVLESERRIEILSWSLFNLNGQIVKTSGNSSAVEIKVTGLTPGIYLLNLKTTEGMKSEKVSIQ